MAAEAMSVVWTVLTDGRPYIFDTLPAWKKVLGLPAIVIDDSGDPERREQLSDLTDTLVTPSEGRAGYIQAMRSVFQAVRDSGAEYWVHTEDDFMPLDIPDLQECIRIIDGRNLTQMAWMRQPWYPHEKRAGGVLQVHKGWRKRQQRRDGDSVWFEHQSLWTCNPAVNKAWIAQREWPDCKHSEMIFSDQLVAEGHRSAFWGKWGGPPLTKHIGDLHIGVYE